MESDRKELHERIEKLQGELEVLRKRNEVLEKLCITDELTGLYNQRHFWDRLGQEVAEHKKQQRPLCLLLFDIDDLKTYNDTYGHLGGDNVLKGIAQSVTENLKPKTDASGYRYGGDEFVVILPEARAEQAVETARRINQGLRDAGLNNVNLSFGIAELSSGMDSRTLFRHADDAMYMAKRGRGAGLKPPVGKIYVYD